MRELSLKNFVHFDNDVLIYKPFSSLKNVFMENRLNITKSSNAKIIFGYSYINSDEVLIKLKEKSQKLLNTEYQIDGHLTMMFLLKKKILGNIHSKNSELFNLLPILPNENKFVFDPSSYGHYLDGTSSHPRKIFRKGYINPDHYIGREIRAKELM